MGLQVRLRHSLGERVLSLPDRAVDAPVVIGRAADADVQVPSIHVGHRHLVLFIHEGRWIVQNGPDHTGTAINGKPLPSACVLQIGDVLTLGDEVDAPSIEIEGVNVPGVDAVPVAQPTQEPADDWLAAAATTAKPQAYYVPKRRKSSDIAVALAVVGTVCILSAAGVIIYLERQKSAAPAPVVVVQAPTRPTTQPAAKAIVVADPTPKPAPPPPPADVTDVLAVPGPGRATTRIAAALEHAAPEAPSDAEMNSDVPPEAAKAFKIVEGAYFAADPAKCLLALNTFEADFPDVNKEKVAQYREDMLDKAWWVRIEGLVEKQKELTAEYKKTQKDIQDETEEAFKKTVLAPRLESLKTRLAKVSSQLTKDMNYSGAVIPPIGEEDKLKPLREKRNRAVYGEWKAAVLKSVRDNHGAYPWANER